ncbi:transglutaminase family protein [soil metagenome]
MRLHIRHETVYTYETPATRATETLRLTPRGHDGQFIVNWRIDVDRDVHLDHAVDPFGNSVHSFTAEGPLDGLTIVAGGNVETQETNGTLSGQIERFPPVLFLRDTALTTSDESIRAFADTTAAATGSGGRLALLHNLTDAVKERIAFDADATNTGSAAIDAFRLGHGVCQDLAHIYITAARHLGIPARYASGYLYDSERQKPHAGHAWAEAFVEDLGWVGFDATNGMCPTESYVRLAVGLDYLGAAPVRGVHYGGSGEKLAVRVTITPGGRGGR